MKEAIPFRAWFYFRMGWATYFAFIFAAVNTLTVTYFLAIENYPSLQVVFPSFVYYIVIVSLVGIPLLATIGYVHFKKSPSFRAESAVSYESNPWALRDLVNSEYNLVLSMKMLQMITKLSKNESLNVDELDQIQKLEKDLKEFMENRTGDNKKDLEYFKTWK